MAIPHPLSRDSPSPGPMQASLSKRDVRRSRMAERLAQMTASFAANTQQHYRAQLQAVQVDMNLILRADPYAGLPLEDGGDDIRTLVEETGGLAGIGGGDAERDYWAMAGTRYRTFVREANEALEERDAELTALHNAYESSVAEVERLTQQRLHQAEEEHKALANTVRQRLITTITKRRQNLLRDKEQLDIADSSALLLHPSQFSLTNPGSPGYNNGQNRKTRHLRHHRAASPNPAAEDAVGNGKRRRKNADDDGHESPAPAFRPPPDNLGGGRSPFKDAREKNTYIQFEAPAYSLERLFTEKELAMATDTAKMATYRYFHHPPPTQPESAQAIPSEVQSLAAAAEGDDAPGTPAAAPEMERTTSSVLTRGTLRANPMAALADLATAAETMRGGGVGAGRENPFAPVVPSSHAVTRSEKFGAPAPLAINTIDAENDLEMMHRGGQTENEHEEISDTEMADSSRQPIPDRAAAMRRSLLLQALGNSDHAAPPYRLPLLETGPAKIGKGVDRTAMTGFAPVASLLEQKTRMQVGNGKLGEPGVVRFGGEDMSRTSSAQGTEMNSAGFGGEIRRGGFAGRK